MALGQVAPGDAEHFKPGTILTFNPPHHMIVAPAFTDRPAYRAFIGTAARSPLTSLKQRPGSVAGVRMGDRIQVERLIGQAEMGAGVTTIEGRLLDGSRAGQTAWVHAACFREPSDPVRDAIGTVPPFALHPIAGHTVLVGETLHVHNALGDKVYAPVDIFAHRDKAKFARAGDKTGLSDMLRGGRILLLSPLTRVLVDDVHEATVITANERVAECRVLEGEHRGRLLWVATHELAEYSIEMFDPAQDFDALSAAAIRSAEQIEKSGRKGTAFKRYKEIVRTYPGTAGAYRAAARIRALSR